MNKERLLQVADAIERGGIEGLGFNMAYHYLTLSEARVGDKEAQDLSGHDCGTIGCIAGWTVAIFRKPNLLEMHTVEFEDEAASILELHRCIATELFRPEHGTGADPDLVPGWDATPAQAAMVIRHLVETGEVDWGLPFRGEEQ